MPTVFIQILGCNNHDILPNSFFLFTDNKRYLVNVGDGTQRFCCEHKIRLTKLSSVFLSSLQPNAVGGLPGLLLTLSDNGLSCLNIYGPPQTSSLLNAFRHFYCRPSLAINVHESSISDAIDPMLVSNNDLKVIPIILAGRSEGKRERHPTENKEQFDDLLMPCVCYIFQTSDIPGKFNMKRAKELGIKGPQCGQLVRGETITLNDGRLIHPSECVDPTTPGPIIISITCPSRVHLVQLISSPIWAKYQISRDHEEKKTNTSERVDKVCCIIHFTPIDIVADPRYVSWMRDFGNDTSHIMINEEHSPKRDVFLASSINHTKLGRVFPSAFQATASNKICLSPKITVEQLSELVCAPVIAGDSMLKFSLQPTKPIAESITRYDWADIDPNQIQSEVDSIPTFSQTLNDCKRRCEFHLASTTSSNETRSNQVNIEQDIATTFLGTGSMLPAKYRNVSAILVEFGQHGPTILFDTGEGTHAQLIRRFGRGGCVESILCRLAWVWISHNHADHHLGLPRLLIERKKALQCAEESLENCALPVIGPSMLENWLDEYAAIYPHLRGTYRFINCSTIQTPDHSWKDVLCYPFGFTQVYNVPVVHCIESYGIVVEVDRNCLNRSSKATIEPSLWSVVYSGDTRPCEELIRAKENPNLLIHEATFEDSMVAEAIEKKHSTVTEALWVAQQCHAEFTILTHFSQRYPKVPSILSENMVPYTVPNRTVDIDEESKLPNETEYNYALSIMEDINFSSIRQYSVSQMFLASDLMTVYWNDMSQLPFYLPCLQLVHPDD